MKKLNVLANVALFEGIGIKDILSLINSLHAAIKKYETSEMLLVAGDPVANAGVVLEGSVQVLREDVDGNRMGAQLLTEGQMFCEALAGAQVESSPVSVQAAEACSVLWMDIQSIVRPTDDTNEHHSRMAANMLKILSQGNLDLQGKVDILSMRTTRGRVMAYLNEMACQKGAKRFTIPYNRIGLADFLCVDRSAMTRELSKMQKEGMIDFRKNEFEIL